MVFVDLVIVVMPTNRQLKIGSHAILMILLNIKTTENTECTENLKIAMCDNSIFLRVLSVLRG